MLPHALGDELAENLGGETYANRQVAHMHSAILLSSSRRGRGRGQCLGVGRRRHPLKAIKVLLLGPGGCTLVLFPAARRATASRGGVARTTTAVGPVVPSSIPLPLPLPIPRPVAVTISISIPVAIAVAIPVAVAVLIPVSVAVVAVGMVAVVVVVVAIPATVALVPAAVPAIVAPHAIVVAPVTATVVVSGVAIVPGPVAGAATAVAAVVSRTASIAGGSVILVARCALVGVDLVPKINLL